MQIQTQTKQSRGKSRFLKILGVLAGIALLVASPAVAIALNAALPASVVDALSLFLDTREPGRLIVLSQVGVVVAGLVAVGVVLGVSRPKKSAIRFGDVMVVWRRNGQYMASLLMYNRGNEACSVRVSLSNFGGEKRFLDRCAEDVEIPLLPKGALQKIDYVVDKADAHLERALYDLIVRGTPGNLTVVVRYADARTGRERFARKEYSRGDIHATAQPEGFDMLQRVRPEEQLRGDHLFISQMLDTDFMRHLCGGPTDADLQSLWHEREFTPLER